MDATDADPERVLQEHWGPLTGVAHDLDTVGGRVGTIRVQLHPG